MSNGKKIISLLLSLIMALSVFAVVPFSAAAAATGGQSGDFTYTLENGEATITGYTGSNPTATVPAVIDGCPVTKIGEKAFYESASVKSVILPDPVREIGDLAFSRCAQLESISIPKTLTTVTPYAFDNTPTLKTVTFEEGITKIPDDLFHCSPYAKTVSLEQVTIPASVTEIGKLAFSGCQNLMNVTFAGDAVTKIDTSAFAYCGFTSIDLPDNLQVLGALAFGWNRLESLEIPRSLREIDLGNRGCGPFAYGIAPTVFTFEEGTTKIIPYLFDNCTGLKSIEIPGTVTEIGDHAFNHCSNLESITIPASVTSIGADAFAEIENLTICGYVGSYAEQYAAEKGIDFLNIGPAILGDVDSDGEVNIIDATVLQRYLVNIRAKHFNEAAADVDADGTITIVDVTFLSRSLVGIPTPCKGIAEPIA